MPQPPFRRVGHLSLCVAVGLVSTACGTLPNGRAWGEDGTLWPGWERLGRAALDAVLDPQTLVPVAGAMVFGLTDLGEEVSDWARDRTPLFQSNQAAMDFSDFANVALGVEFGATLFATPSGDTLGRWGPAKVKGLAVEGAAAVAVFGATNLIKDRVDRERPDGDGRDSLVSGHTSAAFTFSTLSNRNLESLGLSDGWRRTAQTGNVLVASLVGWARVEGGRHFPSDVLAGAALGHFLSAFIHDAFLGLSQPGFEVVIDPGPDEPMIAFSMRF